jgi:hypothetical protein
MVFFFQPEYSPWNDSSAGIGVADGDTFNVASVALVHKWDNALYTYVVTADAYQKHNMQTYLQQQIHAAKTGGCGFYYAIVRPIHTLSPEGARDLAELESFGDSGWRKDDNQPIDIIYAFCTGAGFAVDVHPGVNPDIAQMGYSLFCDKAPASSTSALDLRQFAMPLGNEQHASTVTNVGELAPPAASAAEPKQSQVPKMPSFFSQLGRAAGTAPPMPSYVDLQSGSDQGQSPVPTPQGVTPSDLAILASPTPRNQEPLPAADPLTQVPTQTPAASNGESAESGSTRQSIASYWEPAEPEAPPPLPVSEAPPSLAQQSVPPPLPLQAAPPPVSEPSVPPPLPPQAAPPPLPQQSLPPPLPEQSVPPPLPVHDMPPPLPVQSAPPPLPAHDMPPPLPVHDVPPPLPAPSLPPPLPPQASPPPADEPADTASTADPANWDQLTLQDVPAAKAPSPTSSGQKHRRQSDGRRGPDAAATPPPLPSMAQQLPLPSPGEPAEPAQDAPIAKPEQPPAPTSSMNDMNSLAQLLGTIGRSQPDSEEPPPRRRSQPAPAAKPAEEPVPPLPETQPSPPPLPQVAVPPIPVAEVAPPPLPISEPVAARQEPAADSALPPPIPESAAASAKKPGAAHPDRPLKEPITVKSGVAGLVSKLEQQASKASMRLEAQVDEIQERLTVELNSLLSQVNATESRSIRNAQDLSVELTDQLNKAAAEVTEKIADSAGEGCDTIKQRLADGDNQLYDKHEYVRTAMTNSLDQVKARAEALGRKFEENLTGLQSKQLDELTEASSKLSDRLGALYSEYEASMTGVFNAFREKLDSANQAISNTIEGRYALLQAQLEENNKRALSSLGTLRTARLHKLEAAFVSSCAQLRELTATSMKDKINPRLSHHREEMRQVTCEFQDKLAEDLAQKAEEKLAEFQPVLNEKRKKLLEFLEATTTVKEGIEQQLHDRLQHTAEELKHFVDEAIDAAQVAYKQTEDQLAEIDRTLRALADPSRIEGDLELLNERNNVLHAMDESTEAAKDEVLTSLRTSLATLEEKGKQLQEELISSMEEDAYRVRRAAEQALSSVRETIKASFAAIQSAQDERMPM